MKCEKCGHFNPYWRTDWRDTEREFARVEDAFPSEMPEEMQAFLKGGKIVLWNGFAWKMSKLFIRRMPREIYQSRTKWGLPYKAKDYFDASMRPSGLAARASTYKSELKE